MQINGLQYSLLALFLLPFDGYGQTPGYSLITEGPVSAWLSRSPVSLESGQGQTPFHLVYEQENADGQGSRIFYRYALTTTLDPGVPVWSEPIEVTHSPIQAAHPSLLIDPDGSPIVAWHDYRHTTAEGNYIDNVEIYLSVAEPGSLRFEPDYRVTESRSGHNGDNGYVPVLIHHAGDLAGLTWYDFASDGHISEIYYTPLNRIELASHLPVNMPASRVTMAGNERTIGFSVPTGVTTADGTTHLFFTSGFSDTSGDLYYLRIESDGAFAAPVLLIPKAASYFAPPSIALDPDGRIWVAFTDRSRGNQQRRIGIGIFHPDSQQIENLFYASPDDTDCSNPDVAVDPDGIVHLVWQEIVPLGFFDMASEIRYAAFTSAGEHLTEILHLTDDDLQSEIPNIAVSEDWITAIWQQPTDEDPDTPQIAVSIWERTTSVKKWELW